MQDVQCFASPLACICSSGWLAVSVVGKTEITSLSGWVILSHSKSGRGQTTGSLVPAEEDSPLRLLVPPDESLDYSAPHRLTLCVCRERERTVKMLCASSPGEATGSGVAGVTACRSGDSCWGVAQPGCFI